MANIATSLSSSARIRSVRARFATIPLWERFSIGAIALISAICEFFQLNQIGYGNTYYAAAVRSMMQSWHNFFFVSYDPGGFVTVDKPPVAFWVQTIFAKVFGFNTFSLIAPSALATVASVVVLYWLVRRIFGVVPALLAALALAVMPISVVSGRSNNVDALLVLVVLLAAGAVTLATERGDLRWLIAGGALVGLGFNIKMLEAYLVVPALALLYLLGSPRNWRTRFVHLVIAGAVMAAVSLAWITAVDLTPAAQRPYVGSSGTNSEWNLALGYNGLQRLTGLFHFGGATRGGAPATGTNAGFTAGENGAAGPFRLLNTQLGPQVSWLLPLGLLGLLAAIWQIRPRAGSLANRAVGEVWLRGLWDDFRQIRLNPAQMAFVLWGMWALTMIVFFSVAGFFHTYYLVMLAPAIAALAGIGAVGLWQDYRGTSWRRWLLPVVLVVAAAIQVGMLGDYRYWNGWLQPVVLLVDLLAAAGLALFLLAERWPLAERLRQQLPAQARTWLDGHQASINQVRPHLPLALASVGLAALLLAPLAWSFSSLDGNHGGNIPSAGPIRNDRGFNLAAVSRSSSSTSSDRRGSGGFGPGGFGPPGGGNAGFPGAGGPPSGADGTGSATGLDNYLLVHRGNAKFILATLNSMSATPIIIATGQPVMAIGGFAGADQILTTPELEALVKQGTVRYFMAGGGFGGFQITPAMIEQLPEQYREMIEGFLGGGRGSMGAGMEGNGQLTQWVSTHCAAVPASQYGGTTTSGRGGFGGGGQLYDCANPKP